MSKNTQGWRPLIYRTDRTDRTDWRSGTQSSSHWLSAAVWTYYHLHDCVIISGKRFDLLHLGRTASYTSSQREREGNARTLIVLPLGNADRYLSDFCSYSVIFNSIHEKKTKKKNTRRVCAGACTSTQTSTKKTQKHPAITAFGLIMSWINVFFSFFNLHNFKEDFWQDETHKHCQRNSHTHTQVV